MKQIILITGSVRSGKSDFALKLAEISKKKVVFLATCIPQDEEMRQRVKKHKLNRPKDWKTIEESINICSVIEKTKETKLVVIDCLTLWISNLILSGKPEKEIFKRINSFIKTLKQTRASVIIVSNEVGWGIVPENKLARMFRDIIGITHQKVSRISSDVYLIIGGLPLKIK